MSGRRIGNYLITDYIGGGGFGTVFKAEDTTQPGRVVAIKELHKKHTRNAVIKQRFFQEAVAMARLDHPNLPRLFTFGEDNGSYYLVMEFIAGRVLADELHERGPMTAEATASVLAQSLEGVSYAHRNGIIHRDLKPDNIILIDDRGELRVKVLDFGIARLVGGESLTLAGEGFGTPAYMSPERMSGNVSDDPRIDIYSLGIILFEMLAGRLPFQSTASDPVVYWTEMRSLHEQSLLPPLSGKGIPPDLERIIHRAAAKRAADRYASADDMLADLKRAMGENVGQRATGTLLMAATETARLALTTVPGGAEIYVDDALRGTSDAIRGKILIDGLAPGLRAVRVTKAGYSEYRISVALESGQQTDLQVALPARQTVMAPPVGATVPGSFGTEKLIGGNEVQTALLTLESLPAGSTVFLGSQVLGLVGEDGRATVRLAPGAHELRVTDPNGQTSTRAVNIGATDSSDARTVLMQQPGTSQAPAAPQPTPPAPVGSALMPGQPQGQAAPANGGATAWPPAAASPTSAARPATISARAVTRAAPSSGGRRIAYAITAILLIALAAGAVVVFRRPGRGSQAGPAAGQEASVQPAATPAALPDNGANANSASGAAKATDTNTNTAAAGASPQTDAERAAMEKKLADAERKLKEEQEKNSKNANARPEPPAVTPVPIPEPPKSAEAETKVPQGSTCLGLEILDTVGAPAQAGLRILIVDTSKSSEMYNGRTNMKGRWHTCGLTPGHTVRVTIFGPRGMPLASREHAVGTGFNRIQVQLDRNPGGAARQDTGTMPEYGRKRPPRWQRP